MRHVLTSGKAANLASLATIPGIVVPPFTVVTSSMNGAEARTIVDTFLRENPNAAAFAIRSSAPHEDAQHASFAGMYESKLNVPGDISQILSVIEEIRTQAADKHATASHYAESRGMGDILPDIDVIVQAMVNAERAGVLLSHTPGIQDGYWLVSTTDGLGDAVANGSTNGELVRVARGTPIVAITPTWLAQLIEAGQQIESAFNSRNLDIEFAFENDRVNILQCRTLSGETGTSVVSDADRLTYIDTIAAELKQQYAADVLGDMIDINPAELLGANPSPLEVSVFRFLFGDSVVERGREELGYAPLHTGLIRELGGKPYVSLRNSAYSLRPAGIPNSTYEKMVGAYLARLRFDPSLQNRVEFDVIAMRPGEKLERVMEYGNLDPVERDTVRTAFAVLNRELATKSLPVLCALGKWRQTYESGCNGLVHLPLEAQLEHARVGTLMFVQIARLAFYWKNVFEEEHPGVRSDRLMRGRLWTWVTDLKTALRAYHNGELSREDVVKQYGHIRPGQFALFGETYADDPDYYLFGTPPDKEELPGPNEYELEISFRMMTRFMEARENVKHLFARALSRFASSLHAEILRKGMSEAEASRYTWQQLIGGASPAHVARENPSIILPEVLTADTNLHVVRFSAATPTYVTSKRIAANICVLDTPGAHADVAGKLVLIRNADPGFDYLFRAGAAGIITQNGGPASHMCIRSVEMRMPACIGCGQQAYLLLSRARSATLDCDARRVSPH